MKFTKWLWSIGLISGVLCAETFAFAQAPSTPAAPLPVTPATLPSQAEPPADAVKRTDVRAERKGVTSDARRPRAETRAAKPKAPVQRKAIHVNAGRRKK